MAFRFLDLPREIRDEIYQICLVSDTMIKLSWLQHSSKNRITAKERRLDIHTDILRTCTQVRDEGRKIFYGLNMFYVELQARWQYTRAAAFRDLIDEDVWTDRPLACLKCSKKIHGLTSEDIAAPKGPGCLESQLGIREICWGNNASRVRRLYVNLRPYSYQQYHNIYAIKFHLRNLHNKHDRALIDYCSHCFEVAIPPKMQLDLLIAHVTKRPVVSAEDNNTLIATYHYLIRAAEWREDSKKDMAREVAHLLEFASLNARVVVTPHHGTADLVPYLDELSLEHWVPDTSVSPLKRVEEICTVIPRRFMQAGFLALSRARKLNQEHSKNRSTLWVDNIREFDESTAREVFEQAKLSQELVFLPPGKEVVYDCI